MSSNLPRPFRPGRSPFDDIMHVEDDGTEWWSARELMPYLGYSRWENLENVIRKARSACRNTGHDPSSVFRDVTKIVDAGPLQRGRADVQMLRFGCYLVAMNGDPDKSEVAAAQRYFAVMTRVAEKQVTAPAAIIEKPRPWSERFRETTIPHLRFVNVNHPGCFTVVTTLVAPILYLEDELIRHMLKPGPSDRPDVSIGLCWANDRRSRGLPDVERFAPLCLPDQEREVWLKVYDNAERGECEAWFARTYLRDKLPNYLTCKPSFRVYGELPPASAADNTCQGLTGQPAQLKPYLRRQLTAAGGFFRAGDKVPMIENPQRSLFDGLT
jgi:hypothetical protein